MNRPHLSTRRRIFARVICGTWLVALLGVGTAALAAPPLPMGLATYPLFLAPPITPNVLVLFDNSGSMDATMSGKVVSGDATDADGKPITRGNIAREVLRNVMTKSRSGFNWGLGTFDLIDAPKLYNTTAYFIGSDTTMIYTNDCSVAAGAAADATGYSVDGPKVLSTVPGVPAGTFRDNCLRNPDVDIAGDPRNGKRYLTFERSGDEADINDVFYNAAVDPYQFGIGIVNVPAKPNRYNIYRKREATTSWTFGDFKAVDCTAYCPVDFQPTDAGWLPESAKQGRMVLIKRGWGYGNNISGGGKIVEPVVQANAGDEPAHFAALMAALAPETNAATSEIKNGAFSTPLAGTVKTARDYFAGKLAGNLKSPVTQTCQKNYVVLATDGNPTGKMDGTQYQPAQWLNTPIGNNGWSYGVAQQAVFDQIGVLDNAGKPTGGLRSTVLSGPNLSVPALQNGTYDVKSYVVGLGDTVFNPSSIAALNEMARIGGGYPSALLGSTPKDVEAAFQTIVGSIEGKQGGASSVAINTAILSATTAVYQATFDAAHWTGDLRAFAVNANGTVQAQPAWSAATQLKAQNWDGGRTLLTAKPSAAVGAKGIAFRWPANPAAPTPLELDPVQITALNTAVGGLVDGYGEKRLRYLRGDTASEATNCPKCTPTFRDRKGILGDLVNSTPILVGAPASSYYDDLEAAAYSGFAFANRNRAKVLYVGGNDGMLHAFDAATGRELMGYLPSALIPSLNVLTAANYQHRYFVDGTPSVGDAFYAGSWKTLLVAGMRAGARGVYALDVTAPGLFGNDGNAASIVRWEFLNSQDADMGHLFSQPVIAKTNNGRWSVIVANGYDSGSPSGHAVLFVLDAETGAVVSKIDTGAGTAASPNGLSGPAAIDTDGDGIVDIVYAGDLNGNLWKFDLSGAVAADWAVGNGGVALYKTDAIQADAGTRSITSRPNVSLFPRGGFMVVFGSGRYLTTPDVSNNSQQALYGVWDNLVGGTVSEASLVPQTVVSTANGADGVQYRLSTHAVDDPSDAKGAGDGALTLAQYYATRRGWFLNLPTSGERSVTDTRIRGGRAIFTTLIPNIANPCAYEGAGWLIELDVMTGNRDDRGTFDTNNSGTVDGNDRIAFVGGGGGTSTASGRFVGGIPATPGTVGKPDLPPDAGGPKDQCIEIRYVSKSDGTTDTVVVSCGKFSRGRAMWREVR